MASYALKRFLANETNMRGYLNDLGVEVDMDVVIAIEERRIRLEHDASVSPTWLSRVKTIGSKTVSNARNKS